MYGVLNFQQKNGLIVDGIVGRQTVNCFMNKHKLSKEQTAHFFGQLDHESAGFKASRENLNYSSYALIKLFSRYRKNPSKAIAHHRQPEKIANYLYCNRMGNGNEQSGDGWKFRGNGAIQITGRNNHQMFANYVNRQEIMDNPDLLWIDYYFDSAKWFFDANKLWSLATSMDKVKEITRRINGGFNGLQDRINKTQKYYELIK